MNSDPKSPLSRLVPVEGLTADGQSVTVEATPEERKALAAIDGLVALDSLIGRFRLRSERAGGVRITGTVEARITQTCTVSLDVFDSVVSEAVDVSYLPEKALEAWMAKHKLRPDEARSAEDEDMPDEIVDGRVDLGSLTAEFLALGLEPYPRKPGVAFEAGGTPDKDPSPFAALAKLKRDP